MLGWAYPPLAYFPYQQKASAAAAEVKQAEDATAKVLAASQRCNLRRLTGVFGVQKKRQTGFAVVKAVLSGDTVLLRLPAPGASTRVELVCPCAD